MKPEILVFNNSYLLHTQFVLTPKNQDSQTYKDESFNLKRVTNMLIYLHADMHECRCDKNPSKNSMHASVTSRISETSLDEPLKGLNGVLALVLLLI